MHLKITIILQTNMVRSCVLTKGISKFRGISDLANKESNRIIEMKKILDQILNLS